MMSARFVVIEKSRACRVNKGGEGSQKGGS
jgi:hypothetical protein